MVPPLKPNDEPSIASLINLIHTLRGKNGCPWDRKQTPSSLTIYLIEEVYELVDAIESGDTRAICEELGDVMFQLFFIAALYEEAHQFSLEKILKQNLDKMVRRHPHVFGDAQADNDEVVKTRWRKIKQAEKGDQQASILDSVPNGTPALTRAYRISERVAGVGFDWPDLTGVMEQVESEWEEFKAALTEEESSPLSADRQTMEFGDILFSMINVARLAKIHPETALSRSTHKFAGRFHQMEALARKSGQSLEDMAPEEMAALWQKVKRNET